MASPERQKRAFLETRSYAIFSSLCKMNLFQGGRRMSGSAAKVVITERQQDVLRKLSTATTVAKRLTQRATVILLAFDGLDNEAIGQRVGLETSSGRHLATTLAERLRQTHPDRVPGNHHRAAEGN